MWRKAVERERLAIKFNHIKTASDADEQTQPDEEVLEKKSSEFEKLLEVSSEERDRVQRMQVIDRAAAAIAAARALLKDNSPHKTTSYGTNDLEDGSEDPIGDDLGGIHSFV